MVSVVREGHKGLFSSDVMASSGPFYQLNSVAVRQKSSHEKVSLAWDLASGWPRHDAWRPDPNVRFLTRRFLERHYLIMSQESVVPKLILNFDQGAMMLVILINSVSGAAASSWYPSACRESKPGHPSRSQWPYWLGCLGSYRPVRMAFRLVETETPIRESFRQQWTSL